MTTLKLSELLRYRLNMDNQQAPAGGYVHRQNVPSAFWTVNHGLGQKYVVVEVIRDDNLTNTGRYNYPVIDFADSNTLTVAFDYLATGVIVVAAGSVQGEKGEPGNIVAAGSYIHDQPDPDTVWNIEHNLGHKYVTVELVDEYDTVITGRYDHPTITYVDENNVFVAFDYPKAGKGVVSIGSGGNIEIQTGSNIFLGNSNLTGATIDTLITNIVTDYSNVNVAAYLSSQRISSANIGAFQLYATDAITSLQSNAATQATLLNTLTSNAVTQSNTLDTLTANAASQATLLNTLTSNAASQAGDLTTLTSNAASQAGTLTTLLGNAITQQTSLIDLLANATTQAQQIANAGGSYGNAQVATYLPTYSGAIAANIVKNGYTWTFGTDGTTILPAGGVIAEGGGLTGAIRLTPAGGANANQALLIYPTAAGDGDHVHLTAGGGSTELYLGNDLHYVKLVDGGNVELRATTANLSSQAAWTFDTTGNIDTIQALGIKVPNGVPTDVAVINSTTGSWEMNPRSDLATTGGTGTGLTVNVTETGGYASTIAISEIAGTGYTNGDVITVTSGTSSATFTIVIGGRNTWQFGTDRALTLPSGTSNIQSVQQNGYQSKVTVSPFRILSQARRSQSQSYSATNEDFTSAASDGNGMIAFVGLQGGVAEFITDTMENGGVYERTVRLNGTGPEYGYNSFNDTDDQVFLNIAAPAGAVTEIRFSYTRISKIDIEPDEGVFRIESEPSQDIDIQSGDELRLTATDRVDIDTGTNMRLRAGDGSVEIITNFQVPGATEYTWQYGTDGNLTLPETGYLRVGSGIVAGFASSPAPVISGFSSISAENFRFQGNGVNILAAVAGGTTDRLTNGGSEVVLQANGVTTFGNTATISNNLEFRIWADNDISVYRNGRDGYGVVENEVKVFADNTQITATTPNGLEIKQGNLVIPNDKAVVFANGVNILSTVGAGAYGNTQVASYLLNFDGDIEFTSSTARIGNVDVITVMDSVRSPAYQFSNGTSIFDGITGTYSNTNVAAYLTTGVTTANLTATGNVVQQSAYYETYGNISNSGGNLTCNFNLGTTFYAALTANVTANFTNVNAIASTVSGATIIVDQGATAYRIANVQVNGVNQTVRWVGAVAGAGTASNTDIVSFSLIHLGGGAYRVLGQQSSYG